MAYMTFYRGMWDSSENASKYKIIFNMEPKLKQLSEVYTFKSKRYICVFRVLDDYHCKQGLFKWTALNSWYL